VTVHAVQYHVVVRAQTAVDGGPGAELFELTSEVKNLVWQRTLNLPGNLAFTLMRDSPKLKELDFLKQHIEVYREDRNGVETIFRGKIVQPDYGASDCVILCWDYLAFFQRVRVDYYLNSKRKRYARKALGFVVDDLFDRSIDPDSIVAFVKKGTIQNPRNQDDTTNIKTGNQFGIANLPTLLKVYYDLAEMGMSNTDNTVVMEVDADNKFNFWRDRRADNQTIGWSYPGTIFDFGYSEGYASITNDIATLVRNQKKPSGRKQMSVVLMSGKRTSVDTVRRMQRSVKLGTFLGISKERKDKGKKRLALERIAKADLKLDRLVVVHPRQGVFTRFPSAFNVGHNMFVNIEKRDGAALGDYLKLLAVVGGWSAEQGEEIGLSFREKEDPDPG
jgi:hypothetical protein